MVFTSAEKAQAAIDKLGAGDRIAVTDIDGPGMVGLAGTSHALIEQVCVCGVA